MSKIKNIDEKLMSGRLDVTNVNLHTNECLHQSFRRRSKRKLGGRP